jgi:hypothetical protein
MTSEPSAMTLALVIEDRTGAYYVLPEELIERGRVAEEHKAAIEHLLTEQDVEGYVDPFMVANIIRIGLAVDDWFWGRIASSQPLPQIDLSGT